MKYYWFAVKDEPLIAKPCFFQLYVAIFKTFLMANQVDRPMAPFLFNDLFKIIKIVMFYYCKTRPC